ncbi:MAG: aminoacetone oxidase family FAD-binding enzyme [Bacteroidales bacterium]|nr:aminoacetone oxidase family FAD-binding enzyme [Bacteroidales bacterium]
MKCVIIGGGAAGCFAAIEIARRSPKTEVILLEAGPRTLAKVAVTGGGRCNLTNSFAGVDSLEKVYPRGFRLMKRALRSFSHEDTVNWFRSEGVRLVTQEDGCVFPASQDAMQIVRTLQNLMARHHVKVFTDSQVISIEPGFKCTLKSGVVISADKVLVTTGGSPKPSGLSFLEPLQLEMVPPVPSLFTMKVDSPGLNALSGTLASVTLGIAGTSFRASGTLLITDWGISGPAALKLSSYAARHLAQSNYSGTLLVNWLPSCADIPQLLSSLAAASPQKQLSSAHPDGITSRLWEHLISRAGLRADIRCPELGSKGLSRLSEALRADSYPLAGRVHFKEEFVTCGGVSLREINPSTMECRKHPGLFFAGEVLDIDAVTGGFNLQAAWSTGYCAAVNII